MSPRRAHERSRVSVCFWLLLLIAFGLGSRRLGGLPEWITLYAGDVAWGALFFTLFCLVRPTLSPAGAWVAAVVTTEIIEFSELYHTPWLDALRATRAGGLLLGHLFLWSDVVCVALGATLAAGAELAWQRVRPNH
ncbi:MAG TPA: DUF2809 domain-containing protein [Polyangiaceae bacterium]|nr:DUF2809 domain-containing protein [Polyangiaceae bacterium]